jgi:hypothetical protein
MSIDSLLTAGVWSALNDETETALLTMTGTLEKIVDVFVIRNPVKNEPVYQAPGMINDIRMPYNEIHVAFKRSDYTLVTPNKDKIKIKKFATDVANTTFYARAIVSESENEVRVAL